MHCFFFDDATPLTSEQLSVLIWKFLHEKNIDKETLELIHCCALYTALCFYSVISISYQLVLGFSGRVIVK